jgi:hypothetical protein
MGGATQIVAAKGIASQVVGDNNTVVIRTGDVELRLERRRNVAAPKNDAQLLRVNARATDLVGRSGDLAELRKWLASDNTVSFRCIIGRAGTGKTRLALELCGLAELDGFVAGFAPYNGFTQFVERSADWEWTAPTLVVIDNAATVAREVRNWLQVLAARDVFGNTPRLRLLLLERNADGEFGWWADLVRPVGFGGPGPEDLADPSTAVPLSPLSAEDRRSLLKQATRLAATVAGMQSAPELPAPGEDTQFDRRLSLDSVENEPLYLMMAAAEATRKGTVAALSLSGTSLAENAEAAERARLLQLATEFGLPGPLLCHLALCVTLQNGCSAAMAERLVDEERAAMGFAATTPTAEIVNRLVEALPGTDRASVDALRPDVIGEAFLLRGMQEHRLFPDRQEGIVYRAWTRAGVPAAAKLVGTVQDFAKGDAKHPAVSWLISIARSTHDLSAMTNLANALPGSTMALREFAADVQRSIVDGAQQYLTERLDWKPQLALERYRLAYRLSELGQEADALTAAERAVTALSEIAQTDAAYRPELARALSLWAEALNKAGRAKEAVSKAADAVAILRADKAGSLQGLLASVLDTQGSICSALGRFQEALSLLDEAVRIRRELAKDGLDQSRSTLASALCDLTPVLTALGRQDDAERAARESLEISRELSARNPDSFADYYASASSTLSNQLYRMGRYQDAIGPATEAVDQFREFAKARPAAFLPDFAGLLNNLALMLLALNRYEDVLRIAEEAVQVGRALTARDTHAYSKFLARPLSTKAAVLISLQRPLDGATAAQEAVNLFRPLAEENPLVFRRELVTALNRQSQCLYDSKQFEAAVAPSVEATSLARADKSRSGQSLFDFAMSVKTLILRTSAIKDWKAALDASNEGVVALQQLTAENPMACGVEPATMYSMKATSLRALGRMPEAVEAKAEAIRALAPIFSSQPAAVWTLMQRMAGEYVDWCRATQTEPDAILLEPIAARLQKGLK